MRLTASRRRVVSQILAENLGRDSVGENLLFPWLKKMGTKYDLYHGNIWEYHGISMNTCYMFQEFSRNPLPSGSGELGIERKTFTNMPQNIDESPQINKGRRTWVCLARGWT